MSELQDNPVMAPEPQTESHIPPQGGFTHQDHISDAQGEQSLQKDDATLQAPNIEKKIDAPLTADKPAEEHIPTVDLTNAPTTTEETNKPSDQPQRADSPAGGTKRKTPPPPGVDDDEVKLGAAIPTESCDVVRRKIRTFLEAGEMKVGEFCSVIGVSSGAYGNFMKKNGPHKGVECAAYHNAFTFFKKRDEAGLKMPKKQKTSPGKQKDGEHGDGGKEHKGGKGKAATAADLSDIHLEGEEKDEVKVFETCDELRRQISAYMRKPEVTQAQFLRDLSGQYHTQDKKISGTSLQAFRGNKGTIGGNTSVVFYAGYCFFEKLRLRDGKPKSEKRKKMEEIWDSQGGFDIKTQHNGVLCTADERPTWDQYGQLDIVKIH